MIDVYYFSLRSHPRQTYIHTSHSSLIVTIPDESCTTTTPVAFLLVFSPDFPNRFRTWDPLSHSVDSPLRRHYAFFFPSVDSVYPVGIFSLFHVRFAEPFSLNWPLCSFGSAYPNHLSPVPMVFRPLVRDLFGL